jgi:hypothetical protein
MKSTRNKNNGELEAEEENGDFKRPCVGDENKDNRL